MQNIYPIQLDVMPQKGSERHNVPLTNSLIMHGKNNGKKLMAIRIVKCTFEIIHLLTGENPLQIFVIAIINSGPREASTRIGRVGTVRRRAIYVSPLRQVNEAI